MIKNIPNKYKMQCLINEINSLGHTDKYNFFYVPVDFNVIIKILNNIRIIVIEDTLLLTLFTKNTFTNSIWILIIVSGQCITLIKFVRLNMGLFKDSII
jgi:hypothetical protein